MKYCTNCGAKLTDEALFCEDCGFKQEIETPSKANSFNNDNSICNSNSKINKNTGKLKTFASVFIIIILLFFIISCIRSCFSPNSLEDVASEFTEAMLIEFKAKKAVSLMSEELVESYMEQMNFSTEKALIERLDKTLKMRKEDTLAYYGDDWNAKVIDVQTKQVEEDWAIVVVSVSHEGSDALWNTNIDDLRIILVKENNEWRVCDFEG